MEDLLAIFMVFSIPLTAIGGFLFLRYKRMMLEQFTTEEREVLLQLKVENADLKKRMANMETILLDNREINARLEAPKEEDLNAQRVAQMAKKLNKEL